VKKLVIQNISTGIESGLWLKSRRKWSRNRFRKQAQFRLNKRDIVQQSRTIYSWKRDRLCLNSKALMLEFENSFFLGVSPPAE